MPERFDAIIIGTGRRSSLAVRLGASGRKTAILGASALVARA